MPNAQRTLRYLWTPQGGVEVGFGLPPSQLLLLACLMPPLCQFPIPSTKIGQSGTKAQGLSLDKSQREDPRGRHNWQIALEEHKKLMRSYQEIGLMATLQDLTRTHKTYVIPEIGLFTHTNIPRAYSHTIVISKGVLFATFGELLARIVFFWHTPRAYLH